MRRGALLALAAVVSAGEKALIGGAGAGGVIGAT
jgi:hypothetical protein